MARHEIPTHLNVEDKAFLGLSMRQALMLAAGLSGGYSVWNQWPDLPELVRLGMALACIVVAAVLALVRPGGRGLEEWAFVALHYVAVPKVSVWRREPTPQDGRSRRTAWEDLAPQVVWRQREEDER